MLCVAPPLRMWRSAPRSKRERCSASRRPSTSGAMRRTLRERASAHEFAHVHAHVNAGRRPAPRLVRHVHATGERFCASRRPSASGALRRAVSVRACERVYARGLARCTRRPAPRAAPRVSCTCYRRAMLCIAPPLHEWRSAPRGERAIIRTRMCACTCTCARRPAPRAAPCVSCACYR